MEISTELSFVGARGSFEGDVSGPLISVVPDVVTRSEADEIYFSVIRNYRAKQLHRVYNSDGTGSRIDLNSRYTHSYPLSVLPDSRALDRKITRAINDVVRSRAPNRAVGAPHPMQILGYEERCLFRAHADNSVFTPGGWFRNDPLRDITGVLYLSDSVDFVTGPNQYSGGDIMFPNIVDADKKPLSVRPKKGSLLVFPSFPAYVHQVNVITNGYRLAIVNWWSLV